MLRKLKWQIPGEPLAARYRAAARRLRSTDLEDVTICVVWYTHIKIHFKIYFSYNWYISSWTSTLTADCKTCVANSMSPFSQDRNFSPSPDLSLSHKTFYAVSVCQGVNSGSEKLTVVVLGGDIKSDWGCIPVASHISRTFCLIGRKNSTKFVFFIFNIIPSSMFMSFTKLFP